MSDMLHGLELVVIVLIASTSSVDLREFKGSALATQLLGYALDNNSPLGCWQSTTSVKHLSNIYEQ